MSAITVRAPLGGTIAVLRDVARPAPRRPGVAWSHVGDGRSVRWSIPADNRHGRAIAVDVEHRDRRSPRALSAASDALDGVMDPLAAWTALEVASKLSGVPVVLIVRDPKRQPLTQITTQTLEVRDLVVSVGWRERA